MLGSSMIQNHIKNLKALSGKTVEAGWFESAIYPPDKKGKGGGRSVAANARFQETGGIIEHPGGTKYITDAIVKGRFVGTRFVSNNFPGAHKVTKAHRIVVPARPFMRLAWTNFYNDRAKIQKNIANGLVSGKIKPDDALAQMGLILEGYIAKSIRNGNWAPNAPSTIAKKGFNKPLIDSALMLQSLSSKVI